MRPEPVRFQIRYDFADTGKHTGLSAHLRV